MDESIVPIKILILPVGAVDSSVLKDIGDGLKEAFHCKVEMGFEIPVPQDSYNSTRGQHHSTIILKNIQSMKSEDFDRVLGVTDVDLYVPELNFVFREADTSAGIAVISLTRLRQEFYRLPDDERLFHMRAIKEATHEIGNTYGFGHCQDPKCIMYFSNSLRDTDIKGPGFCKRCQQSLL